MAFLHLKKYIQAVILLYLLVAIVITSYFREHVVLVLFIEAIPPICTTIMLWITSLGHRGNDRVFWTFMTLGAVCYLVAQLISSYYKWQDDIAASNSLVADFFWNMQMVMIITALLFIIFRSKNVFKGIRLLFDSAIVIIVIISLSWEYIIYPNIQSMLTHATWHVILINLGFSLSDLGVICCVLVVYLSNKALFHRKVVWMLTSVIFIFFFADTYYLYLLGAGNYVLGHWIDLLWSVALFGLGLSGLYSLQYTLIQSPAAESDFNVKFMRLFLPHCAFIVLFILMLQRNNNWDVMVAGTVLSLVLILAQQMMVLKENSRLVNELKQMLQSSQYIATHDDLSKLPNKRLFEHTLEKEIEIARNEDRELAVMFMDLDRFKNVNDSMGHSVGDQLIQEVSNRLLQVMGEHNGIVARQGGDEFTILVTRFTFKEIDELAQTIIAQLERPFHMGSYNLQTSTSIGIALYPLNGQNKMELLKHADAAMYKAKSLGRGRYCFYTDDLNAGILQL